MPADTIIILAMIVTGFAIFAITLAWGAHQTNTTK